MFTRRDFELGRRIRRRRLALSMSEDLAAAALGVTPERYRAIEAGAAALDATTLRKASLAISAQAAELAAQMTRRGTAD